MQGFFWDTLARQCSECVPNCLFCTNSSQCINCKMGFTLANANCLTACDSNCLECRTTNSSFCLKCQQGHGLDYSSGKCVKCLDGCNGLCNANNVSKCLSCADGFELQNGKCVSCPKGCRACTNGTCSACLYDFYPNMEANRTIRCMEKCLAPCLVC